MKSSAIATPEPQPEAAPEQRRLDALARYDVLDTPREDTFDRLARLLKRVFSVPIALISLIDGHRAWMKAYEGPSDIQQERRDTFCNLTISDMRPLVIEDTLANARFRENPHVVGGGIRFYAGVPLTTPDGCNIGTVCVMDTKPRAFSPEETIILTEFGRIAMDTIALRSVAAVDSLTGCLSRRAFREEAERAMERARRYGEDLTVVAMDLDHFKSVNDRFGHPAGDRVLTGTVAACMKLLRLSDRLGRVGGEEFVALLPHTGGAEGEKVAERIRSTVARLTYDLGAGITTRVTASLGIAALDKATPDLDALLAAADQALYQAKTGGRNRWVRAEPAAPAIALPMRRVLKGGRIVLPNRRSTLDCTVRALGEAGAGIDVMSAAPVPDRFSLAIPADGFEKACRVVARQERHIEVAFA